jgi:hypothetical protein
VAPKTWTPEHYAEEMGELWSELTRALDRLDRLAAEPERLDEDDAELALARLRYQLHLASEHAYGLDPPAGAESAHAELSAALASARDATAEVAEAAPAGGPVPPEEGIARPLVAFLLALCGALAFAAGATLGLWPVWVAGLLAVCASVVAYRP